MEHRKNETLEGIAESALAILRGSLTNAIGSGATALRSPESIEIDYVAGDYRDGVKTLAFVFSDPGEPLADWSNIRSAMTDLVDYDAPPVDATETVDAGSESSDWRSSRRQMLTRGMDAPPADDDAPDKEDSERGLSEDDEWDKAVRREQAARERLASIPADDDDTGMFYIDLENPGVEVTADGIEIPAPAPPAPSTPDESPTGKTPEDMLAGFSVPAIKIISQPDENVRTSGTAEEASRKPGGVPLSSMLPGGKFAPNATRSTRRQAWRRTRARTDGVQTMEF